MQVDMTDRGPIGNGKRSNQLAAQGQSIHLDSERERYGENSKERK